ncbi:hypothetical protein FACS189427_12550 [Planctomycetales bacterium]|nr:hypothetical protein FACS189427_12550 [Planctomycetales bacterium]
MSIDFITAAAELNNTAHSLGFELTGWTKAEIPAAFPAFEKWLDAGMNAGMDYLSANRLQRKHPSSILPDVKSILVLGVSYRTVLEGTDNNNVENSNRHPVRSLSGIAEYARGTDYHLWCRTKLKALAEKHKELFPAERCRGVVDTAPLLERQFAVNAGFGFTGLNTMLINEELGSKFFIASLLSTVELPNEVFGHPVKNSCDENCRLCIEHCPVGALVAPYILDARRCLNYWTIEYTGTKADIPPSIKDKIPFFGCDVCQQVCPKNRHIKPVSSGTIPPETLTAEELRRIAAGTPLERKFRRNFLK